MWALVSPALHARRPSVLRFSTRNISEALVNGFMSKNPDVKVSLFQAGNEVVLEKLELEIRSAGRPAADVVWIQEPAALQRFGKRGLLEKYTPVNANNIRESFRDPDGYYIGTAVTFVVLMYNTKLVPREGAPTAWSSLTEARYRNQVILANPQVSGTGAAVASALYQNYGWSFGSKSRRIARFWRPDIRDDLDGHCGRTPTFSDAGSLDRRGNEEGPAGRLHHTLRRCDRGWLLRGHRQAFKEPC